MGSREITEEINQMKAVMIRNNAMLASALRRLNIMEQKLNKKSHLRKKRPNYDKQQNFLCLDPNRSPHSKSINHERLRANTVLHADIIDINKRYGKTMQCLLCREKEANHEIAAENHVIWECSQFKNLSLKEKKKLFFHSKFCINCGLHRFDKRKPCKETNQCDWSGCISMHNSIFHIERLHS